jgi:hypothetical protein
LRHQQELHGCASKRSDDHHVFEARRDLNGIPDVEVIVVCVHLDRHSPVAGCGMQKCEGIGRGTWQLGNGDFYSLVRVEAFKVCKNLVDK